MTIETARSARVVAGTALSTGRLPLGGLLAVATIWFLGMGVAAMLVQPDAVIGFGPPAKMIPAVVASDGYLLDAGRFTVTARTGQHDGRTTVKSLYAAGAWFVWPVIARGCARS
jgi:hypothetical protein